MEENLVKRVQPHSIEAEQTVIGALILNNEAIPAVESILSAEDFYQRQYGIIFEAMSELYEEGSPVDIMTLQNRLMEKDLPPEITSLSYIGELIAAVPISANARFYAEIVAEKATLRRLIHANEEIANTCYAGKESLESILQGTEKTIFDILDRRKSVDFVPIQDIVLSSLERIHQASKNKNPITGLPSGFTDLDGMTAGFQPSDFILIAARPSMGKTAFVLNIAQYLAVRKNVTTAIFSLEMSRENIVNRMLAMESGVDSQAIRTGRLTDSDWDSLVEGVNTVGKSALIIDDTPGISISELRTKCRKYKLEYDLKIIMIDYLQLMSGSSKNSENRQQEISEISRSLKALARELQVPVIALSQLSRAVESRQDKRPMLSDLRESGAIEQDADLVMFLYRDDYYNKDSAAKNIAEVIVAKQRNGPVGTVELVWMPEITRFGNKEKGPGPAGI